MFVGEVLVVDECTEEAALEVNVVNEDVVQEETAEVEVDGLAELGWVGVTVGLGLVKDKP